MRKPPHLPYVGTVNGRMRRKGGDTVKVIYKYELETRNVGTVFVIKMPVGAKILHLALQHGKPVIWAEVNEPSEVEWRHFIGFWTGWSTDDRLESVAEQQYIGTCQLENGLVYHYYEVHDN